MTIRKAASCKVNLLLNIQGKRPDGFHELETIIQPVGIFDTLTFSRADPTQRASAEEDPEGRIVDGAGHVDGGQVVLTSDCAELPTDRTNLVWRAAEGFLAAAGAEGQVRIHLEKRIPLSAGLGGGSSDAAATLEGLNELFDQRLGANELHQLAAQLGSDVPFFLQPCPALARGRGEQVVSLEPFPALQGRWLVLVYPGFGIPTAWAYQQLVRFPSALKGEPGRAQRLLHQLQTGDLASAAPHFYNALEAPALEKYPLLQIIREFLVEQGAIVSMMSGSGSTVFGIVRDAATGERAKRAVLERFAGAWCQAVDLG